MKKFRIPILAALACVFVLIIAWTAYSAGKKSAMPRLMTADMMRNSEDVIPPLVALNGEHMPPQAEQEIAPDLPGEFAVFPEEAFKIRIPKWWKSADAKIFSGEPYRFRDVGKAFVNSEKSCALIYSGTPEEPYAQSHFINAVTVTASGKPFGYMIAIREVLLAHAPDNPATSTPGIILVSGGMHEPYWPYEFASFSFSGFGNASGKAFRLVSTGKKPLSAKCESEARSILQTFTREFALGTFANADGLVLVASDNASGGGGEGLRYSLFIAPNGANAGIRKAFDFPKDAAQFAFSESEQSLYYITNDGKHAIVRKEIEKNGNIKTKEFSDISGSLSIPESAIIVDFFPIENTIYYLTGTPGCLEYRGSCTTSFFVYSRSTNSAQVIASKLGSPYIVGISSDAKEILLASYFGDAGCWANSYTRVRLSDGYAVAAGSFNGCSDDAGMPQNPEQKRGEDEITSRFGGNRFEKLLSALILTNGMLTPFAEKESVPYLERITTKLGERFFISPIPIRLVPKL